MSLAAAYQPLTTTGLLIANLFNIQLGAQKKNKIFKSLSLANTSHHPEFPNILLLASLKIPRGRTKEEEAPGSSSSRLKLSFARA